jgi:hypothetical protein
MIYPAPARQCRQYTGTLSAKAGKAIFHLKSDIYDS